MAWMDDCSRVCLQRSEHPEWPGWRTVAGSACRGASTPNGLDVAGSACRGASTPNGLDGGLPAEERAPLMAWMDDCSRVCLQRSEHP